MFKKCIDLWHLLSAAEKLAWESAARPLHMTGYAWYMSQCLRPNPGIYLPLAGGTMAGAIDMDGQLVTDLPAPVDPGDATRKAYVDTFTRRNLFDNHSGRHESGGDDEISVAGLSGVLADDQHVIDGEVLAVAAALVHVARHQIGGADPIRWAVNKLLLGGGAGADPSLIDVPTGKDIATGSYTGNDADDRQIATGFKCSLVIIQQGSLFNGILMPNMTIKHWSAAAYHGVDTPNTYIHATNGFVVSKSVAAGTIGSNENAVVYYYWAISE